MVNSKIGWTDHTWNVARGCEKVDADCKFCYMYRDSLKGTRYNPKEIVKTKTVFDFPLKLKQTKSEVWDGPPLIFTSSLTDVGHPAIDPFRHQVYDIIRARPDLIFQMLTKHPERLPEILPLDWALQMNYKNVWWGTSVGHDTDKTRKRVEDLAAIDAIVTFLSLEPLHGPLDGIIPIDFSDGTPCINWVIVGGESGNKNGYRECKVEWIESIIDQCWDAHVPVFVKQLGTHLANKYKLKHRHGADPSEWPAHLRVQQFPGYPWYNDPF
jgi:protein gp37